MERACSDRWAFRGLIGMSMLLGVECGQAIAEPDRLQFSIGSLHAEDSDLNSFNPGVFATWDHRYVSTSVGVYLNSYERVSLAFTAAIPLWRIDEFTLSIFGAIALYPKDGRTFEVSSGDWVPGLGFEVRYGRYFSQILPSSDLEDAFITFGVSYPRSTFRRNK